MDWFRHLLIPHHTNNFRAKILHLDFFALYFVLFTFMIMGMRILHRWQPDILGFATDIRIESLLNFTNKQREEAGLKKLKLDPLLTRAANEKAKFMFDHDFWAHNGPDGTTPWVFINKSGYTYALAGENLAKNFSNSEGVVEAWMRSPTHRENILRDNYEDIGFAITDGILNGEETTLVVQMFGKKLLPNPLVDSTQQMNQENGVTTVTDIQQVENFTPPLQQAINESDITNQTTVLTDYASAVVRKPLVDMIDVTKKASSTVTTGLIIAFMVDAIYIWRRKIVRVSGKTLAHLVFLFITTQLIWYLSVGSIL